MALTILSAWVYTLGPAAWVRSVVNPKRHWTDAKGWTESMHRFEYRLLYYKGSATLKKLDKYVEAIDNFVRSQTPGDDTDSPFINHCADRDDSVGDGMTRKRWKQHFKGITQALETIEQEWFWLLGQDSSDLRSYQSRSKQAVQISATAWTELREELVDLSRWLYHRSFLRVSVSSSDLSLNQEQSCAVQASASAKYLSKHRDELKKLRINQVSDFQIYSRFQNKKG